MRGKPSWFCFVLIRYWRYLCIHTEKLAYLTRVSLMFYLCAVCKLGIVYILHFINQVTAESWEQTCFLGSQVQTLQIDWCYLLQYSEVKTVAMTPLSDFTLWVTTGCGHIIMSTCANAAQCLVWIKYLHLSFFSVKSLQQQSTHKLLLNGW